MEFGEDFFEWFPVDKAVNLSNQFYKDLEFIPIFEEGK